MLNPRLASRYAKSLLDLAIERGELEEVFRDMLWIQAVCRSNRDFVKLLKSPVIKTDKKNKILAAVTAGSLGQLTTSFNKLLVDKNREAFLPEIVVAFVRLYQEYKGIQTVKLTTAQPVSDEIRGAIVKQVKTAGDFRHIELEEKIDEDIIGGFVLQIGDKLIDASVAYDLKQVARQFENNDFIYKIR